MDFNSLLLFDIGPAALKFLLHVSPDRARLVIQLMYLDFSRLFELIQTEFSLNDGGFDHEEFELRKR